MELGTRQDNLTVLSIQLGQSVQILEGPLSHEIVGIRDESHQDVKSRWERNLVVVVDD